MIKEMKEDYDVEEKDAGVDVKCGLLRWSYFSRMQPELGSGDLGCGNQCWWKNGK